MTPPIVGLIGAGSVGSRMAHLLLDAGVTLNVFDVSPKAVAALSSKGAHVRQSAAELCADVDIVVLSLPNSLIVDSVVLGDDGALSAMRPGAVLVDMSTSLPQHTLTIVDEAIARGVRVLDAPISFGPDGMIVFVGGEHETYTECEWLFDIVSYQSFHVGPNSHGHYVKLVQNLLSGAFTGVVGEAVGYAQRAGLDLHAMCVALQHTAAQSPAVERTMPKMIAGEYGDGGTLAMHLKDTRYALETGKALGARMPFTQALETAFAGALERGNRHWAQTGVVTWFEQADDVN